MFIRAILTIGFKRAYYLYYGAVAELTGSCGRFLAIQVRWRL
ncbi:hypothetical protein [Methanobrevibacter sp.]|nr:hypothetical protein [Methanobrevibacter sp.]MEE0938251.1 hypothetical protein [Methanobrevibacter sp.]